MKPSITDTELLARMRTTGDAEAFKTLYDRYWDEMYRVCRLKTGSAEDAADILQDIFCRIWKNRRELALSQPFDAYLFVALRNRVFNYYRHMYVRQQSLSRLSPSGREVEHGLTEMLAAKELETEIRRGIATMPDKMRHVFLLSREEGLSPKRIAYRLSLSEQTIRNQIHKAVKRLRHVLGH